MDAQGVIPHPSQQRKAIFSSNLLRRRCWPVALPRVAGQPAEKPANGPANPPANTSNAAANKSANKADRARSALVTRAITCSRAGGPIRSPDRYLARRRAPLTRSPLQCTRCVLLRQRPPARRRATTTSFPRNERAGVPLPVVSTTVRTRRAPGLSTNASSVDSPGVRLVACLGLSSGRGTTRATTTPHQPDGTGLPLCPEKALPKARLVARAHTGQPSIPLDGRPGCRVGPLWGARRAGAAVVSTGQPPRWPWACYMCQNGPGVNARMLRIDPPAAAIP